MTTSTPTIHPADTIPAVNLDTHAAWLVEYTDTFAGEANYSWVRRAYVVAELGATRAAIVRAAKAAVGLTGVRCDAAPMGGLEGWELRPRRSCTVLFITFADL